MKLGHFNNILEGPGSMFLAKHYDWSIILATSGEPGNGTRSLVCHGAAGSV